MSNDTLAMELRGRMLSAFDSYNAPLGAGDYVEMAQTVLQHYTKYGYDGLYNEYEVLEDLARLLSAWTATRSSGISGGSHA